jgi:hypothetical protein
MPRLVSLRLFWLCASRARYLSKRGSLLRRRAAWLRRLSPLRSSPPRSPRQLWRRQRISTLILGMHHHRRHRSKRLQRERLDREQTLSGVRPGRSPNTKTVRHFASGEQSTTSGIGSSRHAKACTAHLLAYLIRRIRSNPNKSTTSSGEAIKKIAR